ncbi:hypothetical protein [Xanthomarina gelatinilytica]|uniref:hypothetical protein n=1 Tax=Xanthomarina gelatinilytica TaxID=1137281 RepID=UPI003AA8EDFD
MKEISNKMIDLIENENVSTDIFYSQLGYAAKDSSQEIEEHDFIYSFYEQGKYIWNKYKYDLRKYLCNLEEGKPKDFVGETISGDIRSTLEALIPLIAAELNIALGLAIPIACLIMKLKLKKFCSIDWNE